MKAYITGVYGFIGRHLYSRLVESNWEIVPLIEADIVFHLAALTRNDRSIERPLDTMSSNVMQSANIFEQARERHLPVVYTSSAVIFSPIRTPYQISKIAVDELAQWYNENGADIRIVRLADVYGPGMTKGVIAAWREQYQRHGVIDVWEGPQSRDYIYIDDAVSALQSAAGLPKGIFNVGSGRHIDILVLANMLMVPHRIIPAPRLVAGWVIFPSYSNFPITVSLREGMETIRLKEFHDIR